MRFLAFLLISMGTCVLQASGQTAIPLAPTDPYRNFVGSWSGTIPISVEKLPKTVKLVVTEESDQTAMRWDYTFGVKGEEGFERETRWVILQPAQSKVLFHGKHSLLVPYQAQGLRNFTQIGYGAFTAEVVWGKNASSDKITFGLQPNSLSYLWEGHSTDKQYGVILKMVFQRDARSGISLNAVSNKE